MDPPGAATDPENANKGVFGMILTRLLGRSALAAALGWALLASSAAAQDYYGQQPPAAPNQPSVYGRAAVQPQAGQSRPTQSLVPVRPQAAQPARQPRQYAQQQQHPRLAQNTSPAAGRPRDFTTQQPGEHPLMPAIRWAREGLKEVEEIKDYSAVMVKRELVNGKIVGPDYIFLKVRHEPLSAYLYFLNPENVRGQEVIWAENQNNGKMWAHGTGFKKVFGTVSLDPTGPIAMTGNRYPITEIGMKNLARRMLEVAEHDAQYGECEVEFFEGAKINGRNCTCIQVMHPVPRRNFLFHLARIFIDDELNLPIRYEAYGWPPRPGDPPVLEEEYTYLNVKLNNGFTDADFDIRNPNYQFTSGGSQ